MSRVSVTVNGEAVEAEVEPRTHLADFLREARLLTGTHLGCEHGVCGACTVEIDGAPARSCITLAMACEGAEVRTIEGFDEDPLMGQLRAAFTREHALQCGYCTPGMMISARDLIRRAPGADQAHIRREMEGNLCRCTGYVGIVRAVQSVMEELFHYGLHGAHNADVTGTTAEIAFHLASDMRLVGTWCAAYQIAGGDHHTRRAVSALQSMLTRERSAQLSH